jgi:predicted ATPase/class 3 adenylate cyclase
MAKEAVMKCPSCRTENQQGAKFCSNCGTALTKTETKIHSSSTRRTNQDAATQIFSPAMPSPRQPGSIQGERRVVTILFCDIKGSTALAEKFDPEEWADVMNDVFQQLLEPVHRFGGTVARLLGDAILAFFGAPKAHEDDPQRAVLAGLDIVSNIQRVNKKTGHGKEREIQVRVGINTGLVVVGEVDSGFRSEYTAIGDAVNLAARMEQTAQPGTVQVSEETYRLVKQHFLFEPLGQIEVKGKSVPVNAYRVLEVIERKDRDKELFEENAPLIGRDSEVKRLREAISLVKLGRGQIVSLMGEAGIGKSRLIREFQKEWFSTSSKDQRADNDNQKSWLETRSISYSTHLPYGTFSQLVRNLCGTAAGDSQEVIREKIASNCLNEGSSEELCSRVSRAFEVLLGIEGGSDKERLEGEAFKRELFEAMTITWQDWAKKKPMVLVFDDLQWADPASIELLIHLIKLVEEVPILFLCAFRLERDAPSWKLRQEADRDYPHRYMEINLKPLSHQESQLLVDNLLAHLDLPERLRNAVLQKAEGNPFFVEQIIQSLIEVGVLDKDDQGTKEEGETSWKVSKPVEDISIPDTVQALLQARIDRLSEDTRNTLQKAAVIGRSFYYRVLKEISENGTSIDQSLARLEKAGLIRETSRQPELEYQFSHSLTQETAYKSILRKHRREYHLRTGETIERLFPDQMEEAAPLLAYHFLEAGDDRALHYFQLAGDHAYRLYAITEAVTHYTHALEIARKKNEASVLEHLYLRRGRALELNTQYDKAMDNSLEMEETGQRIDDSALVLSAILARAALHSAPSSIANPETARELLDKALTLAKEMGDRAAEARILWNLLLVSARYDDFREGIAYGEKALSLSQELGLQELAAYTLNDLGWAYIPLGDMAKARQVLHEARRIWIELDNKAMLVDNYATSSYVSYLEFNFDLTLWEAHEGLRISKEINNLWGQAYSQICTGWIHFGRGEPDLAIHSMKECLRLSDEAGFLVPLVSLNAELSNIYAYFGAAKKAREHLRLSREQGFTLPYWEEKWVQIYRARTLLYIDEIEEAESLLEITGEPIPSPLVYIFFTAVRQEIAWRKKDYESVVELSQEIYGFSESGLNVFTPQTKILHAASLIRINRLDKAREILNEAISMIENLEASWLLWQALIAMAELEARTGEHEKARDLHSRAVKEIYEIAERAGSIKMESGEDLRALFLNLPDVKAALSFQPSNYSKTSNGL